MPFPRLKNAVGIVFTSGHVFLQETTISVTCQSSLACETVAMINVLMPASTHQQLKSFAPVRTMKAAAKSVAGSDHMHHSANWAVFDSVCCGINTTVLKPQMQEYVMPFIHSVFLHEIAWQTISH